MYMYLHVPGLFLASSRKVALVRERVLERTAEVQLTECENSSYQIPQAVLGIYPLNASD